MSNLLSAFQAPVAFYAMNNVQLAATVLAAVVAVALIIKRRSRKQKAQGAANR